MSLQCNCVRPFCYELLICVCPSHLRLSPGAPLHPGTHAIPLTQLQGQPVAIQGPLAPGSATTLHASSTQTTTLLRLPTTVSLSGQATPPAHLRESEWVCVCLRFTLWGPRLSLSGPSLPLLEQGFDSLQFWPCQDWVYVCGDWIFFLSQDAVYLHWNRVCLSGPGVFPYGDGVYFYWNRVCVFQAWVYMCANRVFLPGSSLKLSGPRFRSLGHSGPWGSLLGLGLSLVEQFFSLLTSVGTRFGPVENSFPLLNLKSLWIKVSAKMTKCKCTSWQYQV